MCWHLGAGGAPAPCACHRAAFRPRRHLDARVPALPGERYIADIDTTIELLHGLREGAVVSYNPKKPGRPTHVHHTYMLAGPRLAMGVETAPGDERNGAHCTPGLWRPIDGLPRDCRPAPLRGDSGMTSGKTLLEAEARGIDYLFKPRQTKNVKAPIERAFQKDGWHNAGQGWQGRTDGRTACGFKAGAARGAWPFCGAA